MRVSIFASGSSGNCALFSAGGTNILIDAGISARRVCAFLAGEGLTPQELDGVLITHEHSDHVSGLPMLLKRFPLRVLAPGRAAGQLRALVPGYGEYIEEIAPGRGFALGGAYVSPFATLHDAAGSVGLQAGRQGLLLRRLHRPRLRDGRGARHALRRGGRAHRGQPRRGHAPPRAVSIPPQAAHPLRPRAPLQRGLRPAGRHAGPPPGAETLILGHLSRHNNTPQAAYEAVQRRARGERAGALRAAGGPAAGALVLEEKRCSA